MEHGDAFGEREGHVHVVLDQEHGHRAIELLEQRAHRNALRRGETGHRLVEQQPWTSGQCECDLEPSLIAVREVSRTRVLQRREIEQVEQARWLDPSRSLRRERPNHVSRRGSRARHASWMFSMTVRSERAW